MYLEQHLHIEGMGQFRKSKALLRTEAGGDQQDGVGAHDACLVELVFIDDEVFPEQRQVDQAAGLAKIPDRTTEEVRIGQDGAGRGASLFVGGQHTGNSGVGMQPAFGGAFALKLGNNTGRRSGKGCPHGAGRTFETFTAQSQQGLQLDGLFLPLHFDTLIGYDIL